MLKLTTVRVGSNGVPVSKGVVYIDDTYVVMVEQVSEGMTEITLRGLHWAVTVRESADDVVSKMMARGK